MNLGLKRSLATLTRRAHAAIINPCVLGAQEHVHKHEGVTGANATVTPSKSYGKEASFIVTPCLLLHAKKEKKKKKKL